MREGKIKTSMVLCSIFAGAIFFLSCYKRTFSNMRNLPIPNVKKEDVSDHYLTKFDLGRHFSQKKSLNWRETKVPTTIGMVLSDSKYKPVDYFYFLKFNNWFKKMKFDNGILPVDPKQNLDCDNFAMLYKSTFGVASYQGGTDVEFAVAVVVVQQVNPFGGIPSGYLHMLNLVFTNKDWYIFEPQTGQFIELHKYPNQEFIQYIIL